MKQSETTSTFCRGNQRIVLANLRPALIAMVWLAVAAGVAGQNTKVVASDPAGDVVLIIPTGAPDSAASPVSEAVDILNFSLSAGDGPAAPIELSLQVVDVSTGPEYDQDYMASLIHLVRILVMPMHEELYLYVAYTDARGWHASAMGAQWGADLVQDVLLSVDREAQTLTAVFPRNLHYNTTISSVEVLLVAGHDSKSLATSWHDEVDLPEHTTITMSAADSNDDTADGNRKKSVETPFGGGLLSISILMVGLSKTGRLGSFAHNS